MLPVIKSYDFKQMKSTSAFALAMKTGGLHIPVSADLSILKRPVKIGECTAPNAIAIQPLEGFEGTLEGSPSELSFHKYEQFAKNGAGTIWFEACAFSQDGIGNPRQLYINSGNVQDFQRLVRMVDQVQRDARGTKPYKVLQLTHSGRLSYTVGQGRTPLTAFNNPYIDKWYPSHLKVVSDEFLEELEDKMVEAARLAAEAGFDAVDLKLCHNYILTELLAGFTRPGKYGGSFENRTRFVMNVLHKIKKQLGNAIAITVRLNAYDSIPYPYGWGMVQEEGVMKSDLTEPKKLIRLLEEEGVRLFNISSMMPRFAPRRKGFSAYFEQGSEIFPYEGMDSLLEATRELKSCAPLSTFICTGLSWFEQFGPNVGAGGIEQNWFDIAGFGRQALAYPDFISDLLDHGAIHPEKCCVTCDSCFRCMEKLVPVGCVVRNPAYRNVLRA